MEDNIKKTTSSSPNNNSSNQNQIDFTDTQKVLQLMKDQNKELKLNKKKLEKLEEKFIQVNTDLKNIINDKSNIEEFITNIFPKDMVNQVIKRDYGTYDKSELSRLWLIAESKNQSEYANVLTKLKSEISDLNIKNKELNINLIQVSKEYDEYKKNTEINSEQLIQMTTENTELKNNVESLTTEKNYLMKVLDEKNAEIQVLNNLELENAELKAKSLLNNLNNDEEKYKDEELDLNMYNLDDGEEKIKNNEEKYDSGKMPKISIKIENLNMGTQTENNIYTDVEFNAMKSEIEDYKIKLEKLKQEFNDYKIKSHKMLLVNENNYNKMLQEYEKVKKELSQLLIKVNNENQQNINKNNNLPELPKITPPSVGIDGKRFANFDVNHKVSKEYLKNVLLKYLEAIAIGNEFETKILENVLFTVLQVSKSEVKYLEDKRITSSFYYNLWYNAKSFLASKIYGGENTGKIETDNLENLIKNENDVKNTEQKEQSKDDEKENK